MHKKKLWITLIAVLVAIFAVGGVAFYMGKSNNQTTHQENKAKKAPSLSQKVDKLSVKQVAGLVIAYSHLKYKKNSDWKDVYKQALSDGVSVKKYKSKYSFGDYTVEAPNKETVYVINKKVVFTISNTKKKGKATVMIGDSSHELGQNKLTSVYKEVNGDSESRNTWQEINHNLDVESEFSEQDDEKEDDSSKTTQNVSLNVLGTLVGLYRDPDWFKSSVSSNAMYIASNYQSYGGRDNAFSGMNYITTMGDPTSYIYFKQEGNNVVIAYVNPEGDESVAQAGVKKETIPLKQLLQNYYSNSSQKQEVDSYASSIQPASNYEKKIQSNNSSDDDQVDDNDDEDTDY